MANSLDTIRNKIVTSIFGRRLGLDVNEFLVGPKGLRPQLHDATSDTTGTNIPNHGLVSVETTTDDTWKLTDPVPGCQVTLFCQTTSTGTRTVSPVAATIITTAGTAGSTISLTGAGASITLTGITTGLWMQTARASSAIAIASS
jgi:hypothetical protein